MSLTVACHRSGQTGFMEQFLTCSEHGVVAEYDDPVAWDALSKDAEKHLARQHPAPKAEPKEEPKAEAKPEEKAPPAKVRGGGGRA